MCGSRRTHTWCNLLIAVGLVLFPNSFSFNQLCSFNKTAEWLNLWLKSYLTFMSTYLFALSAVKWQLNSAMFADGAQKRLGSARSKMGTYPTVPQHVFRNRRGGGGEEKTCWEQLWSLRWCSVCFFPWRFVIRPHTPLLVTFFFLLLLKRLLNCSLDNSPLLRDGDSISSNCESVELLADRLRNEIEKEIANLWIKKE